METPETNPSADNSIRATFGLPETATDAELQAAMYASATKGHREGCGYWLFCLLVRIPIINGLIAGYFLSADYPDEIHG